MELRAEVAESLDEGKSRSGARWFLRGFLAMLPLWAGAIPVGVAYGVAARGAGLSVLDTQLMSVVVFSAAAQVSGVSLLRDTPVPLLVATAMALNVQLLLLGLAIGRQLRLSWAERLIAAALLTDGAYGVSAAHGTLRLPLLLGAGASMFVGWNLGTALGMVAGQALPDTRQLGLDFVVPLAFLAVLAPLLRTRAAILVALAAGAVAVPLSSVAPSGVAVLAAGVVGSIVGAWSSREPRTPTSPSRTVRGEDG